MRSQVTQGILIGLLGVFVGACGSGGGSVPDARPSRPDAASVAVVDADLSDAGCDDDVMGENYCIINPPGPAQGGGTVVARQPPVDFTACKL
jgi:hypothetical protein